LVTKQVATWKDLNEYWSFDDLERANAVLDIDDAIQEALMPEPPGD